MAVKTPQDTLTIDPIAMNVVNRVAAGSVLSGELTFEGGLLVQGEVSGHLRVNGRLIVWTGGVVRGRVEVSGDFYLFGQLGEPGADAQASSVAASHPLIQPARRRPVSEQFDITHLGLVDQVTAGHQVAMVAHLVSAVGLGPVDRPVGTLEG